MPLLTRQKQLRATFGKRDIASDPGPGRLGRAAWRPCGLGDRAARRPSAGRASWDRARSSTARSSNRPTEDQVARSQDARPGWPGDRREGSMQPPRAASRWVLVLAFARSGLGVLDVTLAFLIEPGDRRVACRVRRTSRITFGEQLLVLCASRSGPLFRHRRSASRLFLPHSRPSIESSSAIRARVRQKSALALGDPDQGVGIAPRAGNLMQATSRLPRSNCREAAAAWRRSPRGPGRAEPAAR